MRVTKCRQRAQNEDRLYILHIQQHLGRWGGESSYIMWWGIINLGGGVRDHNTSTSGGWSGGSSYWGVGWGIIIHQHLEGGGEPSYINILGVGWGIIVRQHLEGGAGDHDTSVSWGLGWYSSYTYASIYLSMYLSIDLSIHPSIYLSNLSIHLSNLSISLSV
jgi:hypothetical protein